MMIIRTRYTGPRDFKGSRITATGGGRQLTQPYDHGAMDPHAKVAEALVGGPVKFVRNTATGNVYQTVES